MQDADHEVPVKPANPPSPDPFLLLWSELWQMPRILWTCWCDAVTDTYVGLLPEEEAWPGHSR